jgi:hypothetical protein
MGCICKLFIDELPGKSYKEFALQIYYKCRDNGINLINIMCKTFANVWYFGAQKCGIISIFMQRSFI